MKLNRPFSLGVLVGGALFALIAAAPDPNVAHLPALSLNSKTNVISDNGTALTRDGVAIGGGGGGSQVWTNSDNLTYLVNATNPANQIVQVGDGSGISSTNKVRIDTGSFTAFLGDTSGALGTFAMYAYSNGAGDTNLYAAIDLRDGKKGGLLKLSIDPTGQNNALGRYLYDTDPIVADGDYHTVWLNNQAVIGGVFGNGSIAAGSTNRWQLGAESSGAGLLLTTTSNLTVVVDGVTYKIALVH